MLTGEIHFPAKLRGSNLSSGFRLTTFFTGDFSKGKKMWMSFSFAFESWRSENVKSVRINYWSQFSNWQQSQATCLFFFIKVPITSVLLEEEYSIEQLSIFFHSIGSFMVQKWQKALLVSTYVTNQIGIPQNLLAWFRPSMSQWEAFYMWRTKTNTIIDFFVPW